MSNVNYQSVSNTVLGKNVLQPALDKLSAGPVPVANATAGAVDLANGLFLETAATPAGLLVNNNAANALTVGADTAANAKLLQTRLGLTQTGEYVLLRFHFLTTAVAQNLANTSGTQANVAVNLLSSGADANSQALKVGGASAAGSSDVALVRVEATNVTSGSEVTKFIVLQQAI